jgi:adenylate kinase
LSTGRKVVITGVPGVGKTTVINASLEALKEEGINYTSINFGTCMFEVACEQENIHDRDEIFSVHCKRLRPRL